MTGLYIGRFLGAITNCGDINKIGAGTRRVLSPGSVSAQHWRLSRDGQLGLRLHLGRAQLGRRLEADG